MRGIRGPGEVSRTPIALVALCFSAADVLTGARGEDDFEARPGEIVLLDLTEPYAMSFRDGYDAFSVVISHVSLSESVIRRGARNISASPTRPGAAARRSGVRCPVVADG